VGCEQFVPGRCPEHGTEPERVEEENWFFRLSRYAEPLHELIASGRLRVEPAQRRNEVLAFIAGGLRDFSVSRSRARARGWGIEVPGDPEQVIYVWWDALGNYVSALGYGAGGDAYRRWWVGADQRVHLVGKGVLRFHAVYWPALLLSAGLPLPTEIVVHDYLTVDGRKISKSSGAAPDPVDLVAAYGSDAVRWWLLREVPRLGDVDFTAERLVARANEDLANGLGNLVNRVVSLVHRFRGGVVPVAAAGVDPGAAALEAACRAVGGAVDAALAGYDFRAAAGAVWSIVVAANRYVEQARPWRLRGAELDTCLTVLLAACRRLAAELAVLLPDAAAGVAARCTPDGDGRLPVPSPLFTRLAVPVSAGLPGVGGGGEPADVGR
jgi:methionyl-tRNA synthetase